MTSKIMENLTDIEVFAELIWIQNGNTRNLFGGEDGLVAGNYSTRLASHG